MYALSEIGRERTNCLKSAGPTAAQAPLTEVNRAGVEKDAFHLERPHKVSMVCWMPMPVFETI